MDLTQLQESIDTMAKEISAVQSLYSFWLYGSVVLNDFHPGWGDIDFIAFTNKPIGTEQAEKLCMLRQTLSERFPTDPYFRCFEGVIVNRDEFLCGRFTRLVYWGTSGQRITDRFALDPFARYELLKYGVLVCGEDDRTLFTAPQRKEMIAAVRQHCEGIRRCAVQTDESLYSCGWLLDIARCIYTLRYNDVIAKTQAGEWSLNEHLFPDEEDLSRTIEIRKDPLLYKDDDRVRSWLKSLGPVVQRYADVLERELSRVG